MISKFRVLKTTLNPVQLLSNVLATVPHGLCQMSAKTDTTRRSIKLLYRNFTTK